MDGNRYAPRIARVVALVAFAALAAPASAAAIGELEQKPPPDGCVYDGGAGGQCEAGIGVGNTDSVVSPDGENVYTVAFNQGTLAVLDRDPATGALEQKAGAEGCFRDDGLGAPAACTPTPRLLKPIGVAISPDGKNVYVTSFDKLALTIFERDASTGELDLKAGPEGCLDGGQSAFCNPVRAMGRPDKLVVSPNNLNVYVIGGDLANSVIVLDRDPTTGELEQKPGTDGCISETGSGGECQDGRALNLPEGIAISPDGETVFSSSRNDEVGIFQRNLTSGELSQDAGPEGCYTETGSGGLCQDGIALDTGSPHVKSPVVSPDSENLYVPTSESNAVAIFDRNTTSGEITQKAGTDACISETGTGGLCQDGKGLLDAFDSAASSDGLSVYAGGQTIAVFDRDPDTGALTQKADPEGCVSDTGDGGACIDGFGNGALGGVPTLSADGRSFYAGMNNDLGLAVFDRKAPAVNVDGDGDGVPDNVDNCPADANADQANADGDEEGDVCDADDDNDGVPDGADACPTQPASTPDGCPPLSLSGLSPRRGGQGVVTITLRGAGLTAATQVLLRRAGQADLAAAETFTAPGDRALSARFNLKGAPTGPWDVVAARAGSASALPGAFTVESSARARLGVALVGPRGALGNYPAKLMLQVTNYGNVDATNAVVRVDGFESGAEVGTLGSGIAAFEADDGIDHGVNVSIDRVPAGAVKFAFVKFVPIGDAHAIYKLRPRVVADTIPAAEISPAPVPALAVARQAAAQSATTESGAFQVTGGGAPGNIAYTAAFTPGGPSDEPEVTRSGGGGSVKYVFKATLPKRGPGRRTATRRAPTAASSSPSRAPREQSTASARSRTAPATARSSPSAATSPTVCWRGSTSTAASGTS